MRKLIKLVYRKINQYNKEITYVNPRDLQANASPSV